MDRLLDIMNYLRKITEDFTCQRVAVFLEIAERCAKGGWVAQVEVIDALHLSPPTMSNHIAMLSKHGRPGRDAAGLEWIEIQQDPNHRSRNILVLTKKGQRSYDELKKLMGVK